MSSAILSYHSLPLTSSPSQSSFVSSSSSSFSSNPICHVCGDRASGYHYNALTCEGCKGFFRRSVTRNCEYTCKYGRVCEMDMYMRRKCQKCRLFKCFQVGMKAELVVPEEQCRSKRDTKAVRCNSHQFLLPSPSSSCQSSSFHNSQSFDVESPMSIETSDLCNQLISLYREHSLPSHETLSQIRMESSFVSPQTLAQLTIIEAQLIHSFVSRLPGIEKIDDIEDRGRLMKGCKRELACIRAAFNYKDNVIIFGNELRQWRVDESSWECLDVHSSRVFSFARVFSSLSVDLSEMLLLSSIIFFSYRPFLNSPSIVQSLQQYFVDHLQSYSESHSGIDRFSSLIFLLPSLRSISAFEDFSTEDSVIRESSHTLSHTPLSR